MLRHYTNNFRVTGRINEDVQRYLTSHTCKRTSDHCSRVAAKAKELAERFDVDALKADTAGYLHDISAVVPNDKRIEFARRQGVYVLPEEAAFPMIIHQKLSAVLAKEVFEITDGEILNAVGCHTTLRASATELDKVVFLADKIDWDQDGKPPYLNDVLDALERSLDAAALVYLNYMWERRDRLKVLHPWLVEAREDMLRTVKG